MSTRVRCSDCAFDPGIKRLCSETGKAAGGRYPRKCDQFSQKEPTVEHLESTASEPPMPFDRAFNYVRCTSCAFDPGLRGYCAPAGKIAGGYYRRECRQYRPEQTSAELLESYVAELQERFDRIADAFIESLNKPSRKRGVSR